MFDSIVQGGDGVWEGLRVYNGKVFKLEEHLDRLVKGKQKFGKVIVWYMELVIMV